MDTSKLIRENVRRLISRDGRSDRQIAKAVGIDPSRFSRVMRGTGDFTVEQIFLLSSALDVPLRMIVESEDAAGTREVPVIYLDDFPVDARQEELLMVVFQFSHRVQETSRKDPRAFAIDLQEPVGDCLTGDTLIMSDSQPPRDGDVVIAAVDGAPVVGLYEEVAGGAPVLDHPGGKTAKFDYKARMIQLIRNR